MIVQSPRQSDQQASARFKPEAYFLKRFKTRVSSDHASFSLPLVTLKLMFPNLRVCRDISVESDERFG